MIRNIINGKTLRNCLLLLMMTMGQGSAWAQAWDGTTKHTTLAAAGITGDGKSPETAYTITNANQFVAFGILANNSTAYWKLTENIDLGGHEWPYSGNNTKTFKGHFDGGDHTISNYKITPVTNKANGLFGTVQGSNATTGRAEIKNLKIDDVTILTTENLGSTTHIGALVGNASKYVDLKNVQIVDANENGSTVSITLDNLTGNCNIGGLIGSLQQFSTMEDCTVNKPVIRVKGEGTVGGTCYIGGAIGYMTGSNATEVSKIDKPAVGTNGLTVNNPSVTVHKILSTWYISTAIGRINNYSNVNYVTVANPELIYKAVGSPNNDLYLGTLAGHIQGNVGSATAAPVATLVKNINITGTSNLTIGTGTEEIKKVKAGVVGQVSAYAVIDTWNIANTNVTVNANLTTSTDYIGGGFGMVQSSSTAASADIHTTVKDVTIANSTVAVTGYISKESYIGGAVGRIEGTVGDASKKPQYISVTGLKITGTSQVTLGTKNTDEINAVRAGVVGIATNYATISGWNIATSNVTVNGKLATGVCYLGGCIGQVTSSNPSNIKTESPIPTTIDDITLGSSTITVSGDIQKESYVGGAFGQISGNAGSATTNPQQTSVTKLKVTGTAQVNLCTNNTNTINFVKAGIVGYVNTNVNIANWTIANTDVQVNGAIITADSYVGGGIGHVRSAENGPVLVNNINIGTSSIVGINGNVDKNVYVGGAFGRMDSDNQTRNKSVTATNVNVNGLDMSFGGNFTQNVYAGGIVGYLYAMNMNNSQPTSVINCSASGQIHSSAAKTFLQDRTYAFGGIVGYNNQNATTNRSEIKQCVSEVNFNLSGYTPATATNLTKTGFVVGGVIGRIDNPSLLPEHLYYSGKIYAPYAAVGPIVGVFQKSLSSAAYVYEDYSGEYAAPTLTSQEWEKANTWYYNDYKLGLSSDVIDQTARTKNYSATPEDIGGVKYLTVTDATFNGTNNLNGGKVSQTVLRYTVNNKNQDFGIYPQWSTSSSAYPTYYMYYMQGVNRGVYMENVSFAKELIKRKAMVSASMQTAQDDGNYTFTTSLGGIQSDANFTKTYQWYESDESTAIDGATTNTITLSESTLNDYGGTVYCKVTVSGSGFNPDVIYILKGSNTYVVFVNGASGQDNIGASKERGWTPETAVKTIDHANSLLRDVEHGGTWDNNIIVVMGILNEDYVFQSTGNNPATLTGKWDGKDYNGVIRIKQIFPPGGEHNVNRVNWPDEKGTNCYILGDTKFENLMFYGNQEGNAFIELHGHDAIFGEGLVMQNFKKLANNHGNMGGKENIPEFTIILTATNLSEADIKKYTQNRTKPQEVTFNSGHYGRILAGRFTQNFFAHADNTAHSILASAANPIWAVVNIDIDKNNEMTDGKGNLYTCDINALIAGLTDGSMYGDYTTNFHGGSVAYIVGGNQGNPVNSGSLKYTPLGGTNGVWGQWPNASFFGRSVINVEQNPELKAINVGNLYAGGLGRQIQTGTTSATVDMYMYGRTEVNVKSGTIAGSVYGGGVGGVIGINPWDAHLPYATEAADADNNAIMNKVQYGDTRYGAWSSMVKGTSPLTAVTLHNWDAGTSKYVTEDLKLSASSTTVNITGGEVNGNVYGGGYGYVKDMPIDAVMQGIGSVFGTSNINITGGTIGGSVYGGSEGATDYYGGTNRYGQKVTNIAEMNGTVNLNILGTNEKYPIIKGNIYGAGQGIESGYNTTTKKNEEYLRIATTGNTDLGDTYRSTINITVDLPTINDVEFPFDIYGGGEMGKVDGNVNITLKGGNLTGNVYGGGLGEAAHVEKAKVTGNSTITMEAGAPAVALTVGKNIYGGGNLAQLIGNTTLNLNHGSIGGNVYGGGKGLSRAESGAITDYGKVTGSATITMNNTTADTSVGGDIYGGGALGELTGSTSFTIDNGTVLGYVYGGGALADVGGSSTVNLYGGSVAGAYGGGLGSNDVAAIVGGSATVQLGTDDGTDASKVTGDGIFGCNNLNGTPKGHVFVHVLKTTQRDDQQTGTKKVGDVDTPSSYSVPGEPLTFDVMAVYGGGNKAAYQPTLESEKPTVLIENCENSIAYVYGGGNAAPVPASDVIIYGANAIDNAFAGGNGAGDGNLGADIGYLDYTRDDVHKYGLGTASIKVYGGTIHNVYGGSNTLGYIREGTSVEVGNKPSGDTHSDCTRNVGNTFGGGNKADITSDITLTFNCEGDTKVVYGGANQANVLGDVTINIHSGAYEQVFCGNNQSGVIKGKLTVNIDETGCDPVMIGELYGCGNNAPYSVYGYNADNSPRTSLNGLSASVIANEHLPYGDPEINVISCTRIGRIFGGGFSANATLYGNTHVNVNMIPGVHNGETVTPHFYLDERNNYAWTQNTTSKVINIPEGVGVIGNIYGGGNEAGVVGNAFVNIFTQKTNHHIPNTQAATGTSYEDVPTSANIEGDVFGGSKGSATDPEAGKVTGTTNVLIGCE